MIVVIIFIHFAPMFRGMPRHTQRDSSKPPKRAASTRLPRPTTCATFEALKCNLSNHIVVIDGYCAPPCVFFHAQVGTQLQMVKNLTMRPSMVDNG